jgi:hypothetical protein
MMPAAHMPQAMRVSTSTVKLGAKALATDPAAPPNRAAHIRRALP